MIDFSKQNKINEEVYHSASKNFSLNFADMRTLVDFAKDNKRRRVRLCAHENPKEEVQEMFIIHPKETYVKPHKHLNKPESMVVFEGEADYIIFNEDGSIRSILEMGAYGSGKAFYQTIREDEYHSIYIKSEWLIFLEITKGPFSKEDTLFAHFATDESDIEGVSEFLKRFRR